jgi:acyl-CoA synthetase (AMP-forming)/AMP-acid ligase II
MLIRRLRDAAETEPDRPVVVSMDRAVSYAECVTRSEAFARGLHALGIPRFACVIADTGDLLAALCGSSIAGAEACVYPAGLSEATIASYAATFDHQFVVTDQPLQLDDVTVIDVGDLARDEGHLPPDADRAPTLILTTGTTGRQKAARHDWNRLVAASKHADEQPGARWLLAYNLNQFAGVQVLLHVLVSRATLVAPRSNLPRDALAAMRELGVTHVSATPTFWRFVVSLLDEVGPSGLTLQQITLGGEAVPPTLLQRLTDLFPRARVSQVYGATEFGLGISVRDGRSGLPRSVLERGDDADVQLRVVDGELQVRSRVGMLGYYGEPEVADAWRATGDLVEIRDDRVYFVGRASETINVGGVKVHPLPVEELVGAVAGVEMARAYARPSPITGQIVALDIVPSPGGDTAQIEKAVRAACAVLPAAGRPRRIRFVKELDVRGHKIARGAETVSP